MTHTQRVWLLLNTDGRTMLALLAHSSRGNSAYRLRPPLPSRHDLYANARCCNYKGKYSTIKREREKKKSTAVRSWPRCFLSLLSNFLDRGFMSWFNLRSNSVHNKRFGQSQRESKAVNRYRGLFLFVNDFIAERSQIEDKWMDAIGKCA